MREGVELCSFETSYSDVQYVSRRISSNSVK